MSSSATFPPEPLTPRQIKQSLPRTWCAFFARFGRFTSIQEAAIPVVLGGYNLFLSAKTASGKTEAVVAPLLERLLAGERERPSGLYISPTRALCNDALKRLEPPAAAVNFVINRRTGDHAAGFNPEKPPDLLITTPESLDSILTRCPQALVPLSFVILDELHLLDNTPRGDQLRILLNRVRRVRDAGGNRKPLQFAALSATVRNPVKMGERYFSPVFAVSDGTRRDIEAIMVDGRSLDYIESVLQLLRGKRVCKVLAFCNSRSDCEYLANRLNQPPYKGKVYVHHGSMTKKERERVEAAMNHDTTGVCVATMTMELGIDIGDIECILLYEPPNSVTSLLQRIGRGCRRMGDYSLAICIFHDPWQRLLYETLLRLGAEGEVDETPYCPRHSVCVQQTFSYLHQTRRKGASRQRLIEVLSPLWDETERYRSGAILDALQADDYVSKRSSEVYGIGPRLADLIDEHAIYTNISAGAPGRTPIAVDSDSGTTLGEVATETLHEGSILRLGGRTWQVLSIRGRNVMVRASHEKYGQVAVPLKTAPPLGHWIAQRIKELLVGPSPPERFFTIPLERSYLTLHFLGRVWGRLLALALQFTLSETIADTGGILLSSRQALTAPMLLAASQHLLDAVDALEGTLVKELELGPFFSYLPHDIQTQDLRCGARAEQLQRLMMIAEIVPADPDTANKLSPALSVLE